MGFAVAQLKRADWRRPSPTLEHPRLGAMQASFRRDSEQLVWACLDLVETARGSADLEFDADATGPTIVHEQQLDELLAKLDVLTPLATDAVVTELPACSMILEWQGARLSGRHGRFQLHYWCRPLGEALVTVCFDQWMPVAVRFDA